MNLFAEWPSLQRRKSNKNNRKTTHRDTILSFLDNITKISTTSTQLNFKFDWGKKCNIYIPHFNFLFSISLTFVIASLLLRIYNCFDHIHLFVDIFNSLFLSFSLCSTHTHTLQLNVFLITLIFIFRFVASKYFSSRYRYENHAIPQNMVASDKSFYQQTPRLDATRFHNIFICCRLKSTNKNCMERIAIPIAIVPLKCGRNLLLAILWHTRTPLQTVDILLPFMIIF